MKLVYTIIISLLLIFLTIQVASAYTVPNFPSCPNPGGNLKVEYSSGSHAIPGESKLYNGSDSVYYISDANLVQCFCAPDGRGIQTNWWKINSLSESEIQQLKNLGWNYIANGGLWGLDQAPYMAKNTEYSCGGGGSSNSGSGGGQILASAASTTGSVLGLAATGNISTIYGVLTLGLGLLLSGLFLKRASRK